MTPVSLFFNLLLTAALAVFIVGTLLRLIGYARTPVPLPIPLAPIPKNAWGVAARLGAELFLFRSLFRASRITWFFAWTFHFCLVLLVLVHVRFFVVVVPAWLAVLIPYTSFATIGFIAGLSGLLVRRIVVDRIRYVSAPSDYLHVLLLLGIAATGALMSHAAAINIYQVMQFASGVVTLSWQPLPVTPRWESFLLYAHLLLIASLLLIFPISKLLHGVGIVFNPVFTGSDRSTRG